MIFIPCFFLVALIRARKQSADTQDLHRDDCPPLLAILDPRKLWMRHHHRRIDFMDAAASKWNKSLVISETDYYSGSQQSYTTHPEVCLLLMLFKFYIGLPYWQTAQIPHLRYSDRPNVHIVLHETTMTDMSLHVMHSGCPFGHYFVPDFMLAVGTRLPFLTKYVRLAGLDGQSFCCDSQSVLFLRITGSLPLTK